MRNAFLAGASAFALALGGCSMFHSGDQDNAGVAPAPTPSASQSQSGTSQSADSAAMKNTTAGSGTSTAAADTSKSGSMKASPHAHHVAMKADEVKAAQQKLKDDGDYTGQVDGKYGPMTAQAVKQYQKKNGLHETGRLDHQTLGKLGVGGTTGSGTSTAPAPAANDSDSKGNTKTPAPAPGGSGSL